jgi:hypothetical protein
MKNLNITSALLATFLITGCNSNQIGVTRVDNQTVTPAPQPGNAMAGVASSNAPIDPTIFFEEIRYRDGLPSVVNGFGFLDRGADIITPFILRLSQESAPTESPAFAPVSGGVLLIDSSSSGEEATVRFANIETLDQADLFKASGIMSVASTPNRDVIAWVDGKGNATISRNGRSHQLHLSSENLQATRIVSFGTQSEFYVLAQAKGTGEKKAFLFNAQSPDAEMSFDADQLAISPKGNRVLVVNGSSVQVYDRIAKTTTALSIAQSIQEPRWQDEETVSYWVENSGQPEIDLLNTVNGQQMQVTQVDSSMASAGMICPVWNNGDLYFADYRDGKNLILRARKTSGSWDVSEFAESGDSRFGLICPSVSNSF